jgi:hypothetical protein
MRTTAMKSPCSRVHAPAPRRASGLRVSVGKPQDTHAPANVHPGKHAFDFTQIGAGAARIQRKASIGAPDDAFEREADVVADTVMRMGEPSSPGTVPVAIQRKCAACEDEQKIQRAASNTAVTAPNVHAATRAAAGNGQPLPSALRAYFEPRFGRDFSAVRIHAGTDAAHAARAIQARAYTLGRDIVFGAGEYAPSSAAGRRLLAHELTHVVQQSGGAAHGSIQRAKLGYHTLKWEDFQGIAPARAPEAAGLFSAFDIPGNAVSPNATKTRDKCKVDGKPNFKFDATVAANPADFDALAPYMLTEKSWLQDRLKDDGVATCTAQAAKCERDFDSFGNADNAMCETKVDECKNKLAHGQAFGFEMNGEQVTIDKKDDCEMKLRLRCRTMAAKQGHSVSQGTALANSKRDCKGTFLTQCKVAQKNQKAALLRHEQGHFDITKTIAELARQSLKQKAAAAKAKASGCGEEAATTAVMKAYEGPGKELEQLGKDWQQAKENAQTDYDGTEHGSDPAKQATWETKIKGGLAEYTPASAAPAAPATPTKAPATPPSAPAPVRKP